MTDISTAAPIAIRRLKLPRLSFPKLGLGASLLAIPGLIGDAFKMAYADPYTNSCSQPTVAPDEDLGGRDPNW